MVPEDDYLRLKPADGGHKTTWRIALMALLGCLLLLATLVLQAGATPSTRAQPSPSSHHNMEPPARSPDLVTNQTPDRPELARAASFR